MTDVAPEGMPTDHKVSKPSSGTYGEKAQLDELKAALPSPAPTGQPSPAAQAPITGPPQGSAPPPAPAGLPDAMFAPETPQAPAQLGPPNPGAPGAVVNATQQRLAVLDALVSNPQVSEETREWASLVLRQLTA